MTQLPLRSMVSKRLSQRIVLGRTTLNDNTVSLSILPMILQKSFTHKNAISLSTFTHPHVVSNADVTDANHHFSLT